MEILFVACHRTAGSTCRRFLLLPPKSFFNRSVGALLLYLYKLLLPKHVSVLLCRPGRGVTARTIFVYSAVIFSQNTPQSIT